MSLLSARRARSFLATGPSLRRFWLGALTGLLALQCGVEEPYYDCSVEGEKERVLALMRENYLWSDQLPADVDLSKYETSNELLAALRVPQDRWSHVASLARREDYYDRGEVAGLGIQLSAVDYVGEDATGGETVEHRMYVSLVYAESVAGRADMKRGERILEVNGRAVHELLANGTWAQVFGPNEVGVPVLLKVQRTDGSIVEHDFVKDLVFIESVHTVSVEQLGNGKKVGYLAFQAFLNTSVQELKLAFAELQAAGAEYVVVDLRYNGGGLLDTGTLLGSLILGPEQEGEPLMELHFGPNFGGSPYALTVHAEASSLSAPKVAFLVGPDTASASEMVINGVRPFVDMVLVGKTTHGKPVGMYTWNHCGVAITPITFEVLNADGGGRFFDGIAPDCTEVDDLSHQLGDPAEARFAAALRWLETGSCAQPEAKARGGARHGDARLLLRTPGEPELPL